MPKSNKTKDHKRPRARHRRAPKRAAVVADPRPLNRRVWPSLVAPILDHLLIEHVMYYTCVAKLFNDAVPFLSVVEQLSAEQPQYAPVLSSIVQATLSRG